MDRPALRCSRAPSATRQRGNIAPGAPLPGYAVHHPVAALRVGRNWPPGIHDVDRVLKSERAMTVGHDHSHALATVVALDRVREHHGAIRIEAGVRLVHHHHHGGRTRQRPGQANALALAARNANTVTRRPVAMCILSSYHSNSPFR